MKETCLNSFTDAAHLRRREQGGMKEGAVRSLAMICDGNLEED